MAMEPRGVAVVPAPFGGDFTMYSATQIPHFLKIFMAIVTGTPEHHRASWRPSVGGGFGSKLNVYAEEALCFALARRLGRPVRWNEDRRENALATRTGRGMIQDIELAADADGRISAVRVHLLADMGAYLQLVTPGIPLLGAFLYTGVYDIPALLVHLYRRLHQLDAHRRVPWCGASRGDVRHRARASTCSRREVGVDPAEIRRRNFIRDDKFPYTSAGTSCSTVATTSPRSTKRCEMVGYEALRREQASRRAAGEQQDTSGSASRPTSRCAAWRRAACSAALNYGAGGWEQRRYPRPAHRQGARSSPAPLRTVRATRRRGR